MADNQPMQTEGEEAKGQHGEEYEEIREQVRFVRPIRRCASCIGLLSRQFFWGNISSTA